MEKTKRYQEMGVAVVNNDDDVDRTSEPDLIAGRHNLSYREV